MGMKKWINGLFIDLTQEEIAEAEADNEQSSGNEQSEPTIEEMAAAFSILMGVKE